jgi:hypothetical protein
VTFVLSYRLGDAGVAAHDRGASAAGGYG